MEELHSAATSYGNVDTKKILGTSQMNVHRQHPPSDNHEKSFAIIHFIAKLSKQILEKHYLNPSEKVLGETTGFLKYLI